MNAPVTRLRPSPGETVADFLDGAKVAALTAAYARIRTLEQQRDRLNATRSDREAQLARLEAAVEATREPLHELLIRRGRGLASDADVAKARATADAAVPQRDAARAEISVLMRGSQDLDREILAARTAAYHARIAAMNDAAARVVGVIRNDAQLIRRLEILYACTEGIRDPSVELTGEINWLAILDEAFPEPKGDELARVMRTHGPSLPPRFSDGQA